ncbi:uncharacterized protein UV8b_01405 [Ustilaginoidea virens]|uniref:Acetyl esterase n=1 Tax=Ustilaginoidea virens TaxID=1159556 RepID=A0A1B5L931_USTVR|nr:uncharacterized protein UV8b_01405 [Ustilaginoidea virens]QUC17164.1 hypothetical protein UV8b_01405 [Ustilaginoidea virens]GAO19929.1 hypothetical protein UVI_02062840 [Ustilaginoidea virens]
MLPLALLAPALEAAAAAAHSHGLPPPSNLVTFGDSYTDEGRYSYFAQHAAAPPVGALLPPSGNTASGGYSWGRLVANATAAKYYNYAVSGAMCTNNFDSRTLAAINAPFPSVLEYQVPAFESDARNRSLYPDRAARNTVYALWIGTNDLGFDGLQGDRQKPNATVATYLDCVWSVFDRVYRAGGRRFVLLNQVPLDRAPMYAASSSAGNRANTMLQYTTAVNTMFAYGAPLHVSLRRRWPGATLALFDVHSLFMDVIANPGGYLDAPANVASSWRVCASTCVDSKSPKSVFMWLDSLHPSERMHQIVAKNFISVVNGRSKYATYYL